jgi:hypothetical protein
MRGTLKALGLALLAALALSAVAATGAQAENKETGRFTAEKFPAVATGHQEGEVNRLKITTGAGETVRSIECASATYEATLPEKSTSLTVTPHYTGCKNNDGIEVHVDLNGCDFKFTSETYTKATEETHGKVHIECPVGKQIEITVRNPFGTTTGAPLCVIDIKAQTGKATLTYTNKPAEAPTPKPYVTVHANVTGLHYVETKPMALCPLTNNLTKENGIFESTVLVKGYEDLGNHVGKTEGDGTPANLTDITTYTEGAEQGIHVKP